jgi:hypothetical protein
MDPDYTALAAAAATAVVTAMAKEGWEGVRSAVARLWRKGEHPQTEQIVAELERSRQELVGTESSLVPLTSDELVAEWKGKLRRLLVLHPELADEVAAILGTGQQGGVQFGDVSHHGTGDVNQAGRDIHVTRTQRHPDA